MTTENKKEYYVQSLTIPGGWQNCTLEHTKKEAEKIMQERIVKGIGSKYRVVKLESITT